MNNQAYERVMPYTLAQDVSHDDIHHISGGLSLGCLEMTNKAIFVSGQPSLSIDVRADA